MLDLAIAVTAWTLPAIAVLALLRKSHAVVYIPNGSYGVVEKLWSLRGSRHKDSFISLHGEAGFLPETPLGGFHFFFPFKYRIHQQPLITVRGMAYLFARAGRPMEDGQTLGRWPGGVDVTDARAFLENGGQQGPQRKIQRQGAYPINTALFAVLTEEAIHAIRLGEDGTLDADHQRICSGKGYAPVILDQDMVGVVTVHDGTGLDHGEIIAPAVGTDEGRPETFHNSFQDIEKFLSAGGRRGRQEQVIVEGTYYINRLFATVTEHEKKLVPIGHVGVVISYTGPQGADVSGSDYKHGQLVESGQRGVWREPLQPGKYAVNPFALLVKEVPTTNFVLRWQEGRSEDHGFDTNLKDIPLITRDAFEPVLGLNVVVHVGQDDAPYVIQQFADLNQLVEQTLDPMVSAWFKDAAQAMTLIELVNKRAEIQAHALAEMKTRFAKYKLNVMEVMIGTPRAPAGDRHIDMVFEQLRARQVAKEQIVTYTSQQEAADKERELRESEATAAQQPALTASKVAIQVAENHGCAELARKTKDAEALVKLAEANARQTKLQGEAEAARITMVGNADASRITAVGTAEASASKAQVEAFGGAEIALRKAVAQILGEAIAKAQVPLVPNVVMAGGAGAQAPTVPELLTGIALARGGFGSLAGAEPSAAGGRLPGTAPAV